jgi:2-polyprenyl-3-methyl-5-hydroxy-6-metoxy-1,4-benzoquinol methylase
MKYTKNYFNKTTVKNTSVFEPYIEFISQTGIKLTNKKICDIGCATGEFFERLPAGNNLYGVDISQYAVDVCKKKFPKFKQNFAMLDLNTKTFSPLRKFDIITMFDVIEHLDNFTNLKLTIKKNLKKGGYFILTTPNAQSFLRFISKKSFTGEYDKTHTMLFTPYTLDFFLRKAGLRKIANFTPYTFYFKSNSLTKSLLFGGQIFAIYKK